MDEEYIDLERDFEEGGNVNEHSVAIRRMVVAIGRLLFWYVRHQLEKESS